MAFFPTADNSVPTPILDQYNIDVASFCSPDPIHDITLTTGISPVYTLTVKAYHATYESGAKFIYWYVRCNDPHVDLTHPFRYLKYDVTETREIVADNEVSRSILKYLCLPDNELSKLCGNCHVVEYRATLIKLINKLWD